MDCRKIICDLQFRSGANIRQNRGNFHKYYCIFNGVLDESETYFLQTPKSNRPPQNNAVNIFGRVPTRYYY